MRMMQNIRIAAVLALACICACSKNNTSQTTIAGEAPPPAPAEAESAPARENSTPAGPIAGSVLDVVSPDSPIPQDVLQAMADYGVSIPGQARYWHTEIIDIDNDGSKELLVSNVREWCGSGGCSVWLWQRTRKGLRNLLPSEELTVAALNIEKESTNGYRNISIYHRVAGRNKEFLMVSDLYVWNGSAFLKTATTEHGKYLEAHLPATAWKVAP